MCSKYHGIKLESALERYGDKIENLSSTAHVVYATAKEIISGRREDKNGYEMYKKKLILSLLGTLLFSLFTVFEI